MKKKEKVLHVGRAANCPCKTLEGDRCPDCRHLLGQENKCIVCGRVITERNTAEITLQVQNASQKAGTKLK
jgi:hypothetical protein